MAGVFLRIVWLILAGRTEQNGSPISVFAHISLYFVFLKKWIKCVPGDVRENPLPQEYLESMPGRLSQAQLNNCSRLPRKKRSET